MEEYTPEYITVSDPETGAEEVLELLFTFNSEDPKYAAYNYCVLAKDIVSEDGEDEVELYAYRFEEKDGSVGDLFPIEDEAEQDMVNEVIDQFITEANEEADECECGCGCHCDHE